MKKESDYMFQKITSLLLCFFLVIGISGAALAANKLKYKIADGDVVCIGSMKTLEASAGERVVSVDFGIPSEPVTHYTFDGEKLVRKPQPVIDKMEAENDFSFTKLMGELNNTMEIVSIVKLGMYSGVLQSMCEWKNWDGINGFLEVLVSQNIATEEEAAAIKAGFAKQNIIIGNE